MPECGLCWQTGSGGLEVRIGAAADDFERSWGTEPASVAGFAGRLGRARVVAAAAVETVKDEQSEEAVEESRRVADKLEG